MTEHVAPAGLKGLIVTDTSIGVVRGQEGRYEYRGHDAAVLAAEHPFESVAGLVLSGTLESLQLGPLRKRAFDKRSVGPKTLRGLLADVLDDTPLMDLQPHERMERAREAVAAFPVVVASLYRKESGLEPIAPDPTLGHAADYLRMVTGAAPTEEAARALGVYLALTIDHGMNASTFTGRVIASTGASIGAALVGAQAALSGPLHGGAPGRVLEMLEAIESPENTEDFVHDALRRGNKIMGFGHAVYRADDPRSRVLKAEAEKLGGPVVERAVEIEERVLRVLRAHKPNAVIVTNVEYYAALVLHLAGVPQALFTPTFAVSRCVGWAAHVLEESAKGKIIRPSARFQGQKESPAEAGLSIRN